MAVHANWNDRSLLLWDGAAAPELRDLLGQRSTDALLASVAQETTIRLWLPRDGRLEQVELPALKFSPAEAVDLLVSLPNPLPAEYGESVRYWVALARFVTDCVRREKFYPTVRRPNAHHEAVWRLHLPTAEELDRLERFANSMPPSCRAVVGDESTPLGLIDAFLTETADALIRRAVGNDPFFTRVHGLAAEKGAGPEMRLLSAMLASDRTIPGELRENEVLADQVQLWTSRLGGAAPATGWQLVFTLHEPPDDVENPEQATWRVTFRLQPLGDGKALDAAKLWEDVSPLSPLGRQLPELRSLLMAELTRAAEVFAPLSRVLATPTPSEIELSTPEANQFLRQWSVELRARSFAIDLPSWADDTDRRLSLVMALRPSGDGSPAGDGAGSAGGRGMGFAAAGPSRMGLDSLLEFDWRVSLGGVDLTPDEFDALVRRQSPLVKVRGRWVELEADAAAAALELMEKQQAGTTTLGDAFRAAFATTRADGGSRAPSVALAGTAWIKDLLDQLPAMKAQELPQPEAFKGTLRPYQLRGLQWLSFLDRLGIGGCLADDMGLGKAQPLDAKILTPTGWRRMGDITVGDAVIGSCGAAVRVTGVYPQGRKLVHRVLFSDGSASECCDDHLWYVNTPVRRYRNAPGRVLPLRDIRARLRDGSGNALHFIPMVQPVEFAPRELPLHPYLLGVLLGDGGIAHRVVVSSADAAIIDRLATLLPPGVSVTPTGYGVDYRIHGATPGGENVVMESLRRLELGRHSHDKFIPSLYKFAPVADRLELLRGLLDTDGHVRPVYNNIEFCTTSPQLATDVQFLVQSLGGTAPIRQKKTSRRRAYRMSIALPGDIQPFWLERKARVYHPRAKYPPARAIVGVEEVGEKEVQCIAVDAADHLYVTDDFIVTHNTIQLIALLLHERMNCQTCGPTLLFAPTSVVGNWVKELERFAPQMRVLLHHGPQRRRGEEFINSAAKTDVVITSYALAHRDRDDLAKLKWHRIALDEAQKIKNPSAASSVAIRSLSAPRRIALTGTPIENHLSELWSIMDVLNPGLLGSARDFRERFAVPIEKLLDRDRGEHLRRMIRPFVLRRSKTDPEIAGDLPDKIEMKVFCNLTPEQAAMYERATAEMLGQIDAASGIRRRGLILAVLTRLKQICDHPALLSEDAGTGNGEILDRRSGKCERLVEMLEEVLEEGESALVFTQYAQMGTLLQKMLSERLKANLFYLHGGTPQKQRDEMVVAFQEAKTPSIFILSLRAGGLGLNLTAANHVFHFDRWWNPAVENQATDRAHRIGQKRSVQVHKFIAVGTVEERIDRLLTEKTQLAESIVGGGDEWLTDLSTSELREYLRLSDEAVGEF